MFNLDIAFLSEFVGYLAFRDLRCEGFNLSYKHEICILRLVGVK